MTVNERRQSAPDADVLANMTARPVFTLCESEKVHSHVCSKIFIISKIISNKSSRTE
jgi:hypothetical protein